MKPQGKSEVRKYCSVALFNLHLGSDQFNVHENKEN